MRRKKLMFAKFQSEFGIVKTGWKNVGFNFKPIFNMTEFYLNTDIRCKNTWNSVKSTQTFNTDLYVVQQS